MLQIVELLLPTIPILAPTLSTTRHRSPSSRPAAAASVMENRRFANEEAPGRRANERSTRRPIPVVYGSSRRSVMENDGRLLPNNSLAEEVPAEKPLCGRRSKFVVSTTRREILGGPLHRTVLPPTLQGFFYGNGVPGEEDGDQEEDFLPCKNYGRFARLPGTNTWVDPSLSFVCKALPGKRHIFLVDSCNGLLLLGHMVESNAWPEFVVCNPATQQWEAVPSCVDDWVQMDDDDLLNHPRMFTLQTRISLLFDPAVSSHFKIVIFWNRHIMDDDQGTTTVHTYSSETKVWRSSESDWSPEERQGPFEVWRRQVSFYNFMLHGSPGAFVGGKLYLNLAWCKMILEVDTEGKTRGIFPAPLVQADAGNEVLFVGRSQGRLHCIVQGPEQLPGPRLNRRYRNKWRSLELSIWVLGDSMDTQEWMYKHKVSHQQLFGTRMYDYRVVAMHPDCDIVFFHLQRGDDHPIISYDFDHQEVRVVDTYKHHPATHKIIPYAPYLSELFLGVLGGHK